MCFVNILLRCVPIALQLAGACVVINAMSLVGSIDDILNHAKLIATIPHDKSPRIYLILIVHRSLSNSEVTI